jgi:hypothetical protein
MSNNSVGENITFKSSIEDVLVILHDHNKYPEYLSAIEEVKILDSKNDGKETIVIYF